MRAGLGENHPRGNTALSGLWIQRENRFATASSLEEDGFELVWGLSCQVVFFGLLPVLCSEREVAVLHPVAYDQVPGARATGQGTETLAKLGALSPSALVFGSALTPEHAEGR